jgi:hypothetical protein
LSIRIPPPFLKTLSRGKTLPKPQNQVNILYEMQSIIYDFYCQGL